MQRRAKSRDLLSFGMVWAWDDAGLTETIPKEKKSCIQIVQVVLEGNSGLCPEFAENNSTVKQTPGLNTLSSLSSWSELCYRRPRLGEERMLQWHKATAFSGSVSTAEHQRAQTL